MDRLVEQVNLIEEVNGELAQTAESAWIEGAEPFTDREYLAVAASLARLRRYRDELEEHLDTLLKGLVR